YLAPDENLTSFAKFLRSRSVEGESLTDRAIDSLYAQYAPNAFSLADLGYITQVHPLELWLVSYLRAHPQHNFDAVVAASHDQRIAVYNWLFSTGRKNAQDMRIRSLLEVESFEKIHQDWKRLGYPFDSLVSSYATAIGTSADRPAALAELMGILVNNGVRLPAVSVEKIHFAAGTPYETVFVKKPPQGERLLPAELTVVVRRALQGVVEQGTAGRLRGVFKDNDGNPLIMGGKTGTGDHRFDTVDASGHVVSSRVVNRTATMVFFIGDKFFGTMTAIVRGEDGAKYHFTSSLPAQLIKAMSPQLSAVLAPSRIVRPQPEVEMDDPLEVVEEPAQTKAIPVPTPAPVQIESKVIAPHLKSATGLEVVVKPPVVNKPVVSAPAPAATTSDIIVPQQAPAPIEERRLKSGGEAY
ncbi:MAG: hypothetical protein ABL868_07335, partial [Sulfuriferula sp.]